MKNVLPEAVADCFSGSALGIDSSRETAIDLTELGLSNVAGAA